MNCNTLKTRHCFFGGNVSNSHGLPGTYRAFVFTAQHPIFYAIHTLKPPRDAFMSKAHWANALNSDLNAHKRICTCTHNRRDDKLSVKGNHTFLISITALPKKALVKLKERGCEEKRKKREVPSGEVIKRERAKQA